MDKRIEKKKWSRTKIMYLIGFMAFILLSGFGINMFNKKTYKVDGSRLSVKTVTEGDFQDVILIDGDVQPINLVLVNTMEGGTVEEIFVEDGVLVEKGDPLVKLNNPAATLSYMNQETAIVEQINNLRSLKLSLEKDQRDLSESLIDSENSLANVERAYKVDSLLYEKEILARNNYTNSAESYKYEQKKRDFMVKNVTNSKRNNLTQIRQINTSINLMQRNLEFIHESIDKMLVRAPVSGMLSSFDPVIGESYSTSQTVAKIDVQSGFKIRGQVDEYYLSMVKPGQLARFTFDGELIDLKVTKVLSEVVNRRFEIELIFVNEVPNSITNGQSLQVRLELSKAQKSLLIPRGSYFQSSGGQFVFVLNDQGEAYKRFIKLGSQNPSFYQVLEGLEKGERIITSSYDEYKNYESIKINK